ncbi:MAG: DUF1353 domain-containing protein [Rhizobiales bacterium]|nr:DUF1353 domain-containing protein [Hyphomicrobiales bacterium]
MSSFTDEPTLIISSDGLTATVASGFRYWIGTKNSNRYVDIDIGFKTDGVTLPRFTGFMRPIAPRWAYIKAVLVHDKLCKCQKVELECFETGSDANFVSISQKEIDAEFYTALKALGMPKYKAWIFYKAVSAYQFSKALKQKLN